jgi:hypothetical protein
MTVLHPFTNFSQQKWRSTAVTNFTLKEFGAASAA